MLGEARGCLRCPSAARWPRSDRRTGDAGECDVGATRRCAVDGKPLLPPVSVEGEILALASPTDRNPVVAAAAHHCRKRPQGPVACDTGSRRWRDPSKKCRWRGPGCEWTSTAVCGEAPGTASSRLPETMPFSK